MATTLSLPRIVLLSFLLSCSIGIISASTPHWAWMDGGLTPIGVYGEKGVPSTTNKPSARSGAAFWYESSTQELWLFGGYGVGTDQLKAGYLNDLWRFRMNDSTWTWISGLNWSYPTWNYGEKGNASTANYPSGRAGAVGWYDSSLQEFWVFGGYGYGENIFAVFPVQEEGYLNDLWRYRMNDSTWTWVSGSDVIHYEGTLKPFDFEPDPSTINNTASHRSSAVGWYDSLRQELWLYGGYGVSANFDEYLGMLSDLWKFRMNDLTWTWIAGSNTTDEPAVYGEKGSPSITNTPGARHNAVGWFDSSAQEFWLFGGNGKTMTSYYGPNNDLWRYRVNDSTWTWISGSNTTKQPGVYGEKGTASTEYVPGARSRAVGWFNSLKQEFWLFGGSLQPNNYPSETDDMWRYQVNDDTWTWVSGVNPNIQRGRYGEKGKASVENFPKARADAVGFYDSSAQEFWLFGGTLFKNQKNLYPDGAFILNDLWRYRMNDSTWTWISGSDTYDQQGVYGEKGIPDINNVPGARSGAVGWFDSSRQEFWVFGGHGYGNATYSYAGYLNDLWRYRLNDSTWTWISGSNIIDSRGVYGEQGIPDPNNVPGPRRFAVGCYDNSRQEFWLFGGEGGVCTCFAYCTNFLKYRVNDSTWTWISGGGGDNEPRPRRAPVGWYDSLREEFWLYGGETRYTTYGSYGDALNDLWRFRLNDSTWTWMGGNVITDKPGVHGEKGVASSDYLPDSRCCAVGWIDESSHELWLFGGFNYGETNDLWKALLSPPDTTPELEPQHEPTTDELNNDATPEPSLEERIDLCPPLHTYINNTCIPNIECSSSEDSNSNCTLECDSFSTNTSSTPNSPNCLLECGSASELSSNVASSCVVEGDIIVNGSVVETATMTIVGVIKVAGDIAIIGQVTLKLSSNSILHIDKCLVLDEKAQVVVEVESGARNGSVLLTFDSSCSSRVEERVKIESKQSMEEMCRDGKPAVKEQELSEGGIRRTHLTLLLVPTSGSDECNESASSDSELNVLAITISVVIVVLVLVVIIVVMSVRKIRMKVVPGSVKLPKHNRQ